MEDFFNIDNNKKVYILEENKKELLFEFDNFNNPSYKEDLWSLAQMLHNLLFTIPGNYPSSPEMGINIKQYQFEFMGDEETRRIQDDMRIQIDLYIPSSQIIQILCKQVIDPLTEMKSLGVGFAVSKTPLSTDNILMFFQNVNGKVVSKIII